MLAMAGSLGLHVTAEGVETREQHTYLRNIDGMELQGFLFGKPVPADEIFPDKNAGAKFHKSV